MTTLFSVSQRLRNAGGVVWHLDVQPYGTRIFGEIGSDQLRLVKLRPSASADDIPFENNLRLHVITTLDSFDAFLKDLAKK